MSIWPKAIGCSDFCRSPRVHSLVLLDELETATTKRRRLSPISFCVAGVVSLDYRERI